MLFYLVDTHDESFALHQILDQVEGSQVYYDDRDDNEEAPDHFDCNEGIVQIVDFRFRNDVDGDHDAEHDDADDGHGYEYYHCLTDLAVFADRRGILEAVCHWLHHNTRFVLRSRIQSCLGVCVLAGYSKNHLGYYDARNRVDSLMNQTVQNYDGHNPVDALMSHLVDSDLGTLVNSNFDC